MPTASGAIPVDDLPTPTARELEILKVLWEHGPKSVSEVHRLIKTGDGKNPHMNTVQTLMRLMEAKGLAKHTLDGRTFVYTPLFSREQSATRFLDRVFDGAASQLVMTRVQCLVCASDAIDAPETDRA